MYKKLISLLLSVVIFSLVPINYFCDAEGYPIQDYALNIIKDKGINAETVVLEAKSGDGSTDKALNWKNYIGDLETFVYGLIIHQLEYSFDVFPAYVDLLDGNTVYGIAYTDYTNCYTNEDESLCCFDAGFIPFDGEISASQEDYDSGLTIYNLDFADDKTSFIWTYGSEPIRQHCVVYNQYLVYGIDNTGKVFYEASQYVPGVCDENIGSLYSYDEAKYLFDVDVGFYMTISGVSLFNQLNFEEFEKEINRVLLTQNTNFSKVDIISCANLSQQAIISYLLSLQEETFLGYKVEELVAAANSLDPMECYRITENGLVTIRLDEGTKASDLTKWLVGTGCAILTAVAIVGSVVFIECPALSSLAGAVAGTAIEIFMQVVVSENDLSSVDWRKVAIAATAGAVSGFLGPYLHATCDGLTYFVLDSAIDGFVGGIEKTAEAWMNGSDAAGIINAFGNGFAMGFIFSAGFKGLSAGLSKAASRIGPSVKRIAEKMTPKFSKMLSSIKQGIGNAINGMKKVADNSVFHSQYISKKMAEKQVRRLLAREADKMLDDSVKQLPSDNLYDINGKPITKDMIKEAAKDAKDGAVVGFVKKGEETIKIVKNSNMVGVVFDSSKYMTIEVPEGLTYNRPDNFAKAAQIYKNHWLIDASSMPDEIAEAISRHGYTLEQLSSDRIVSLFQETGWTIHENLDMLTTTLVPTNVHMHVSHMGAVGLGQYIKSNVATEYFDRLVSIAATGGVIAIQ